ncbi:uncharacterized protein LOC132702763 [Cylas formicarius]|uniref:uncharacterized protein LOC132702763 n=1 Tax=Cylas formicarius TaxID=197179 RepID=UPI0029587DF5|nr:uncharacterized protein LOC132702763 [Cylas formicarius]XP_060527500.1 uncharacterized protein LOC132702763 [Cylas formicarius]
MSSSNIYSSDLDEETRQKIKGDMIGDSLYSESFVLKTLLQLSDLKWNNEIEEDYCFLWDMTADTDVCKYLFNLEFPALACSAISRIDEPRFIEIIIGMLANLLCAECDKNITEEEIKVVLRELDTDDSLVLIQVNRFIAAVAHSYDTLPFLTTTEVDKLIFILNNSVNKELIEKTLETVLKITDNFKLEQGLVNIQLYKSVITGLQTILDISSSDFEVNDCSKTLIRFFLQIVTNVCSYTNKFSDDNLVLAISSCDMFNEASKKVLEYLSKEENIFPLDNQLIFYIKALSYIFISVDFCFVDSIFIYFCKILFMLHESKEDMLDVYKETVGIIGYFIFVGNQEVILNAFKKMLYLQAIFVLNSLKQNETKIEGNISAKLRYLFKEFK